MYISACQCHVYQCMSMACVSVYVSVYQCVSVYVSVCQCISVDVNICQCMSVYVSEYQCMSVYISVCQCRSVYINICQCMSVYVSVCQYISVYVSVHQCTSVYVSACQCISSVHVSACQRMSVHVSVRATVLHKPGPELWEPESGPQNPAVSYTLVELFPLPVSSVNIVNILLVGELMTPNCIISCRPAHKTSREGGTHTCASPIISLRAASLLVLCSVSS